MSDALFAAWLNHTLPRRHPLAEPLRAARADLARRGQEWTECGLRVEAWRKVMAERREVDDASG